MQREMEYVYEVYKYRSFSQAAKHLYVSQPALSTTIKKLEWKLKTPLFDRSASPIQVTEAGMFYVNAIEEMMVIEKKIDEYFNGLNAMDFGSLSISTGSFFCSYSLPLHLKPFLKKYPNITVNFTENHVHEQMVQLLKTGKADFVLTSTTEPYKNYCRQFFAQEQLILAVPFDYPINEQLKEYQYSYDDILNGCHIPQNSPKVSLKKFEDLPFISLHQNSELFQRTQLLFQHVNISPQIVMYMDQIPTAYYMTLHGYGFSIIRDSTLHIVPAPDEENKVVFYKIDDSLTTRNIFFFFKNPEYLSKAARLFIDYTKEVCHMPEESPLFFPEED